MEALGPNCECCTEPPISGAALQVVSFSRECNSFPDTTPCTFTSDISFPAFKEVNGMDLFSIEFPFTIGASVIEGPPADPLPEGQGYSGEAFKSYNEDGRIKSEQYVRYRLVHTPSPSCYMKVWFVKQVVDSLWNAPDISTQYFIDLEPYEWNGASGSNGYCLTNSQKFNTDKENIIIAGDIFDLDVGDVSLGYERHVSIAIRKFSVVKGYEPDEPTLGYPFINDDSGRCNYGEYPRSQCFSG